MNQPAPDQSATPASTWRPILLIALASALIAFLLQGRVDGSDTSAYLNASQALLQDGTLAAESFFQIRIGMSLGLGLFAIPFGWAIFSWTIFNALCVGVLSGAAAVACKRWLPKLSWPAIAILTLTIPGVIKAGGMLYPDAAQAALLSTGLLLLFRRDRQLPTPLCAIGAGVCFGWMAAVNPTALRFGLIVVVAAGYWLRSIDKDQRPLLLKRAGFCALAFVAVLIAVAIAHSALTGNAMLLYKQLLGGGIAPAESDRVDGMASLFRWLRGAFGPFGEFGILTLLALGGLAFARKQLAKEGLGLALIWLVLVFLSVSYALLPQMLAGKSGIGEISTRYALPATVPMVVLAGALWQRLVTSEAESKSRIAKGFPIVAGVGLVSFCLLALLMNHKPRFLTEGPEDVYQSLRDHQQPIYATPRQAVQLAQLWGQPVGLLHEIEGTGIAIISAEEEAMLVRKYGAGSEPPIAEGFKLGASIPLPEPKGSAWQSLAQTVADAKGRLMGRTPSATRSKAYWIERR